MAPHEQPLRPSRLLHTTWHQGSRLAPNYWQHQPQNGQAAPQNVEFPIHRSLPGSFHYDTVTRFLFGTADLLTLKESFWIRFYLVTLSPLPSLARISPCPSVPPHLISRLRARYGNVSHHHDALRNRGPGVRLSPLPGVTLDAHHPSGPNLARLPSFSCFVLVDSLNRLAG